MILWPDQSEKYQWNSLAEVQVGWKPVESADAQTWESAAVTRICRSNGYLTRKLIPPQGNMGALVVILRL